MAGEKIMPRTVTPVKNNVRTVSMPLANSHASLRFSSARYLEKTGMNAALTAPSPTSLRRRFGIRNAVVKASASVPAPSKNATRESRMYPKIRLMNVRKVMRDADFRSLRCSLIERLECNIATVGVVHGRTYFFDESRASAHPSGCRCGL
jgi:hypothetical protein